MLGFKVIYQLNGVIQEKRWFRSKRKAATFISRGRELGYSVVFWRSYNYG